MARRFENARVQAALSTPTGYRRRFRFTFSRGGVSQVLEPTSASFTQDTRRSGRWNGKMTFQRADLVPATPRDLLTPFGTTVVAEMGLELLDGTVDYVPYGVYDLDDTDSDINSDSRTVNVQLIDLSDRVDRYRFESPFIGSTGTTLSLLTRAIIRSRTGFDPGMTTIPITLPSPRTFGLEAETGPWEELLDVFDSFGLILWYDRQGRPRAINPTPLVSNAYALTTVVALTTKFDTRPANVIVARGESTNDAVAPVQSVVTDDDPGSPTYAGTGPGTSPYGRRTQYYSSPLITTVAQATSAAQAILAANLGAGASYTLRMPYDPTVDAGDVVSYGGITYVIDSVTLDVNAETTAAVRRIS